MPLNENTPHFYDYSENLQDGRHDLQGVHHFFLDTLFHGCDILDFGAGLGQSKTRIRHNRVFTYDIDSRLAPFIDQAGGDCPLAPPGKPRFDIVMSTDVIEHVKDDRWFVGAVAARASRAAFITTPNWHVSKCQSTHHWREYTAEELVELALTAWPDDALRLFGFFKDRWGGWFDLIPRSHWNRHRGSKHGLLVLLDERDRQRIDSMFEGRFDTIIQPTDRWVPKLSAEDTIPGEINITEETTT